jgi:hypothetical protein
MSDHKLPSDPNGLHFAAGAFIGGMTGLLLSHWGQPQQEAAMAGLFATCAVGALKALRDANRQPTARALKNGALIASGGLITPIMLMF